MREAIGCHKTVGPARADSRTTVVEPRPVQLRCVRCPLTAMSLPGGGTEAASRCVAYAPYSAQTARNRTKQTKRERKPLTRNLRTFIPADTDERTLWFN